MNQTSQVPEMQLVDLGDAKALTLGTPADEHTEDHPEVQAKE
jgi:hypothetical protein